MYFLAPGGEGTDGVGAAKEEGGEAQREDGIAEAGAEEKKAPPAEPGPLHMP